MKKEYTIAIIFFLIGGIACYLWQRPKQNELHVTVKTVDEKTDTYSVHLEYPQFPDLPKAFNKKISDDLLKQVADFKVNSEENVKARIATSKKGEQLNFGLEFLSGWTADQINSSIVSFVMHTYYYTGGAHGGQNILTFNYDVKNKKEIKLDSLFGKSMNYLEKISQFTMNDLKNQLKAASSGEPNLDMLQSGTSPTLENFSRFTLGTGDTINFYFEQYQVAPFVAGEQKVVMPLSYIIGGEKVK